MRTRRGSFVLNGCARAVALVALLAPASAGLAQSDDDELVAIGSPKVTLTSPVPGAPNTAPASIELAATASVPSGTIQKIDFYRDSTLIHADTSAPYAYSWTAIPAGRYKVTARARSSYGITTTSMPVEVRVCDLPTVSLTAPTAGADLTTGAASTVQASAASPGGGCDIARVEFYAQLGAGAPVLVGTALGLPPHQINWTPAISGAYTLTAKAYDERDVATTSAGVAVTVNSTPTVSISAPTTDQVFAPASTVSITAVPADADGTISKVEFYQGATLLGTKTAAPWTHAWAGVAKGNYSLTTKAFDNLNATGTSAAVPIIVTQAPTVSISAPASGTIYANPANITINATAADPDGTIAKVEFFQGSTLVCTDTSSPFTCAWNGVAGGSYSLTAKATDNQGATTTSAAVPIIVNQLPSVSLTSPTSGTAFAAPATVSLAASASDPDGTITEVRFYNGATLLNTDTSTPFAYAWTPVSAGSYSLTAVAVDNRGATSTSSAVAVVVCGAPSVSLTSPASGTYAAPANFTLSADASSACGIQKVEFYDGASLIATDTSSPYNQSWNNVTAAGSHIVKARAYDNVGQWSESQTTIQIVNNSPPVINGVSPMAAQTITGSSVSFSIIIADADSGNLTLTLWNGGTLLATLGPVSAGTHSLSWTPSSAGNYNLTVQVADAYATASQAVSVDVSAPPTSATPSPESVIPGSYPTPAIGTLAGTFAVSESGAASYSIPLKVVPGTAGMEPSLSLNYSSQGSYGQLGVGFTLGGLSSIGRCPMTEAQDGLSAGINYDDNANNDRWCLDGQRLVPVGSEASVTDDVFGNAAKRQEYRTELESYARVESFEETSPLAVIGPYRFRVTTKTGQIMEFGSRWWVVTAGWMQSGVNGLGPLRSNSTKVFVLDRVRDRAGNFIDINYADRDGVGVIQPVDGVCGAGAMAGGIDPRPIGAYPNVEYWVSGMRYYAAGSDPCFSAHSQVVFNYADIPSQASVGSRNRYYGQGAGQTSISKRLTSVEMRADAPANGEGTLVRRYELGYLTSAQTQRELVSSIRECDADGVCLPSTTFNWAQETWNATGKQFATTTIPAGTIPFGLTLNAASNNGVYVGDWNGDGRSDLIGWKNTDRGGGLWDHELIVCLSTGAGFTCGSPILSEPTGSPWPSKHIEIMDIDNDGRVDLVERQNGLSTWALCRSDGNTGCAPVSGTWTTKPQNDGVQPNYRGDFDGDGRIDFITWFDDQQFQTCLTRDTGFTCSTQDLQVYDPAPPTIPGTEAFENQNAKFQILVADVDGDGKADLVRRRSDNESVNEWKVCLSRFSRTGGGEWRCHAEFIKGPVGKIENSLIYDFNGDGLADAANFDSANTTLVCLSTGDGAFEFRDINVHWNPANNRYEKNNGTAVDYYADNRCRQWNSPSIGGADKITFGDFNGDGRTDLLAWIPATASWQVCLSNGSEFVCSTWPGPAISASNPDLNQQIVTGDFNGDGKTDVLYMPESLAAPKLALSAGPATGDVLVKVTTGLGAVTEVTYKPLTDTTVYAKGSGALVARLELDIQSPMYVVQKTSASTGLGGASRFETEYFYEGLRGRTSGRGLYGFAKVRSRDGVGLVTETEYARPELATDKYATKWALVGRPTVVRKYAPASPGFAAPIHDTTAFTGGSSLFGGSLRLVNRTT
ncbi:MAG: VCBS repeat-containing protein, partial [Acidobacteria bacterium]|nr:VCBS repeat-containing protein [Acidobacteriota bacterium]